MEFDPKEKEMIQQAAGDAVPNDLGSRIVQHILDEPSRQRKRQKINRIAGTTVFAVCIASSVLVSQTASAVSIPKVRQTFAEQKHFKVVTYRVEGAVRTAVAETVVDGSSISINTIDATGKRHPLSEELEKLNIRFKDQIDQMSAESLTQPEALESALKESSMKKMDELPISVKGISPEQIDLKALQTELKNLSAKLDKVVAQLKQLLKSSEKGSLLVNGDSSTKYTTRMLSYTDLWDKQENTAIDGKQVTHFTLKQSPGNLHLYVDPASNLPKRVSIRFEFGDQKIVIENDYQYLP
jgi:hypothetical protein